MFVIPTIGGISVQSCKALVWTEICILKKVEFRWSFAGVSK